MDKRVRELMRPNLITCPAGTSLSDAVNMLARYRIHALIVSDPAGLAMGVLSDFDILAGEWLAAGEGSLPAMRRVMVGELMSTQVPSVDVDASASEAAERMRTEHIHRLVVTELERPVGSHYYFRPHWRVGAAGLPAHPGQPGHVAWHRRLPRNHLHCGGGARHARAALALGRGGQPAWPAAG